MDTHPPADVSASGQQVKHRRGWKRFFSVSIVVGFVLGILSVGVFNVAMDWSNKEEFCISCHEMKVNHEEYKFSAHYSGRTGVRAVCVDCHLPREFFPKILHKIKASNDIWHSILGSIDTPEKYEEKREELAQREWRRLKGNDSRECRNCHDANSFDLSAQGRRAASKHEEGLLGKGQTCIECHQGIVHDLPKGFSKIDQDDAPQGEATPE
jgi:cytochrome c-type protein NapC